MTPSALLGIVAKINTKSKCTKKAELFLTRGIGRSGNTIGGGENDTSENEQVTFRCVRLSGWTIGGRERTETEEIGGVF